MLKNQTSVVDDRGYNQGFKETYAWEKRMERRARWMMQHMRPGADKRVLEIGCGTGYAAYYIAKESGKNVLGSDLCQPFIEAAKEKYQLDNLEYATLDFNVAASNVNERFDYIIGNGILHHLYYNLQAVLGTLKTLLADNGKIIFMEPNIYNPYVAAIFKNKKLRSWARLEPDEMAFSKSFIQKRLAEAGFQNINVQYKDFLLPGVPRFLVQPSIIVGNVLEKTPLRVVSQSILISAQK